MSPAKISPGGGKEYCVGMGDVANIQTDGVQWTVVGTESGFELLADGPKAPDKNHYCLDYQVDESPSIKRRIAQIPGGTVIKPLTHTEYQKELMKLKYQS